MWLSSCFKIAKITVLLLLVFLCCAAAAFFHAPLAYASGSTDENNQISHSVNEAMAVNLKEGNWIYATYQDKNGTPYAAVTGYSGTDFAVEIPSALGEYDVKAVSREAFSGNPYITSLKVSEGITEIGKYCFKGCIGLGEVTLPSTLKYIGEGAFYDCYSLTELELPHGVIKIGSYAFYNCRHIRRVVFPDSLKSIGDAAFGKCEMLTEAAPGQHLESIGSRAFQDCKALTSVTLPSALQTMGSGAFINCVSLLSVSIGDTLADVNAETFRGCTSLESVSIGSGVRSIGASAFEGCTSLTKVSLGSGLEHIGSLAFYQCVSLPSVTLGRSVQDIGLGAFSKCSALSDIAVSENNRSFCSQNGRLYSKDGSKLLLCPQGAAGLLTVADGTEEIADYAMNGCAKLSGLSLPSGVKRMGAGALMGCTDVTELYLPDGLEKIGCLSFGYYFRSSALKRAGGLEVFGVADSASALYCMTKGIAFRSYPDTMQLNTEYVVLRQGETFDIKTGFMTRRYADVVWQSSDESVVAAQDGSLKAVSEGSAVVTAFAEGFTPRTVKVEVIKPSKKKSGSQRSFDNRYMYQGETAELNSLLDQIVDPLLSQNKFWYSSNPRVVTVSANGSITAVGTGRATVICRLSDGSENCFLIQSSKRPYEFSLVQPTAELTVGDRLSVGRLMIPGKSDDVLTWSSDNQSVATVSSNGVVTGVSQGNCVITAVTASGLSSSVSVKCIVPAEAVTLNLTTRSVYQGKEFTLEALLLPSVSQQTIVWTSSDPSVAAVNSKGKVTGVSFGTAVIYAKTASGVTASCTVNVIAKAKTLHLDVKKLAMNCGTEHRLHPIIFPSYSPQTTDVCFWNSTNENVAVVDENGLVKAVGVGSCIINCRTSGDLISKCQVQVKMPAQSAELTGDKDSIYIGEVATLKVHLFPENTTDTVEWFSDHEEIARVTANGAVKGQSAGMATITVKVTNDVTGAVVTAEYPIMVLKKATGVKLSQSSLSFSVGDSDALMCMLSPSDSNDTVSWRSTDEKVAAVRDDGLITAVGEGTCYIYAESGSGCSARCKITVHGSNT